MTREELLRYGKKYLHDLETACCKIGKLHLNFVRESIKALEQEQKSEWEHDHEILKAYSNGANEVLDKIRDEIEDWQTDVRDNDAEIYDFIFERIYEIFDEYKTKSEENK